MKPLLLAGGAGAPWKPKAVTVTPTPTPTKKTRQRRTTIFSSRAHRALREAVVRFGWTYALELAGCSKTTLYDLVAGAIMYPATPIAIRIEKNLGVPCVDWDSDFSETECAKTDEETE